MDEKRKKILKIAAAAVGVILIAILVCYVIYNENMKKMKAVVDVNTVYEGVYINDIAVGGLEKDQVRDLIEKELQDKLKTEFITVKYGENTWEINYTDIDAKYRIGQAVDEAYQVAREGSLRERYDEIKELPQAHRNIQAQYEYDENLLKAAVEKIASEVDKEAKNSEMKRENGKFVITDEENGCKLDVAKTLSAVKGLIDSRAQGEVAAVVEEVAPEITKEQNKMSTDLLGSFSTSFSSGQWGRNENLRVGCENINGTILKPGDVFSMNEGLGPQTYENGYRNAAVIINGKIEDGLAGGVCQITTTLYNAVIFSELDVVARRNHSLPVAYVPLGRDAAVAGDYTDFKFKNSTDYPIYIEAYTENNKLYANIYGHETRDPGRTVEFEKVMIGTIAKPAEKVTEDPDLPEGTREVTYTGKVGYKVSTYKKVFQNGELVSREWFSDSTYKATADEVTVGTKKLDTAAASTTQNAGDASQSGVSGESEEQKNTETGTNIQEDTGEEAPVIGG